MKQGYVLDLEDWARSLSTDKLFKYTQRGLEMKKEIPEITTETLKRYKKSNGHLNAKDIIGDLFPNVPADVFLSHSHVDHKNVLALAGYLKIKGANPFVDSFVWGNVYTLLQQINTKYSKDSAGRLDYDLVVHDAAHIFMMLNSSLITMINRTDIFILLETPQAIKRGNTSSPWVYNELLYSQILCPDEALNESYIEHGIFAASLKVDYTAYTDHLKPLDANKLEQLFGKRKLVY